MFTTSQLFLFVSDYSCNNNYDIKFLLQPFYVTLWRKITSVSGYFRQVRLWSFFSSPTSRATTEWIYKARATTPVPPTHTFSIYACPAKLHYSIVWDLASAHLRRFQSVLIAKLLARRLLVVWKPASQPGEPDQQKDDTDRRRTVGKSSLGRA